MKVKLSEIINSKNVFEKILNQELKASCSFKISRLIQNLHPELNLFFEKRNNIIKKYGAPQKDDSGNEIKGNSGETVYIIDNNSENFEKYSNEILELVNLEIEINSNKIKLSEIEDIKITPAEANLLEPFFDIEN